MATLWVCCGCCYSCCVSQAVVAAVPAKRQQGCLQFLWLLKPPSSILGRVLPNLGSANTVGSVNSKAPVSFLPLEGAKASQLGPGGWDGLLMMHGIMGRAVTWT